MNKLAGVPLTAMEDPIDIALRQYENISDGAILFDIDTAVKLEPTPDKPTRARSTSDVMYRQNKIGQLVIIAFDFEDGTGAETEDFNISNISSFGGYPRFPKVVPRSKAAMLSEVHLTIASFPNNGLRLDADPIMYAGSLDLIGFEDTDKTKLKRLAHLGQGLGDFTIAMSRGYKPNPDVTYTIGGGDPAEKRFGDPHAVFNDTDYIQICGFIGIKNGLPTSNGNAFNRLGAVEPNISK